VLLVVWAVWWAGSLRRGHLEKTRGLWVWALPFLSGDFKVSIDHVARIRAAGGDTYGEDWSCQLFPYPPTVPAVFVWVNLMSPQAASVVWTVALNGLAGLGAWAAWASRRRLGLEAIPFPAVLAATLFSSPFIYAFERGQCDALVIPGLVAGAWLLRSGSGRSQFLAGAAFALATWVKYYPGLVLFGLIAQRRGRAFAGFVATGLVVGLADLKGVLQALRNSQLAFQHVVIRLPKQIVYDSHSLTSYWPALWADTRLKWLGHVPGGLAAVGLVFPFLAWVSLRVARGRDRGSEVAYPYYIWLVAVATFLPKVAGDYNLIYLPLAMLAAWGGRDRPAVHMAMALGLLGLQPFRFEIAGRPMFLFKLAGLVATGFCLVARSTETLAPAGPDGDPPAAPAFRGRRAAAARRAGALEAVGPTWG
jgi:hypothetical protein